MKEYNINYHKAVAIVVAERKKRNITQQELRNAIGVANYKIVRFETDVEYTSWNILYAYAKLLNYQITLNLLDAGS